MAAGPVFPGFIKIEYKQDGSSKAKFLADAAQLSGEVKKPFSEAFDSIGKMVDRVSGKFRDGNFKLDIDVSSLREASAQADFTVKKMQALRDAALKVATANNDQSESTRAFVTALQAQAASAEAASVAARDQVTAFHNLQGAVSAFVDQSYAPKVDPRTGLDAFLAGKGAVDSAVMSVTTLESVLGRVQKKSTEVAGALAEVERAAASAAKERMAAEAQQAAASDKIKADAAAEMQRLAQSADALRAELDPAVAAQNRFNAALDRADDLLKAGVIDQRTYAQAVSKAQSDLQSSWRSLTVAQEEQQRVAKKGTTADQSVINSMRSVRFAGIQAGQQFQDMAVQFQMGTAASVVFAQQLPQLAFGLSGLEGNVNKTLDKLGKFATFLAGPWGAAILIAGVVLAPLIENLLGFGDAADKGKDKALDFSNGLQGLTITANEAATAFGQLSQEIRGAIAVQGDFLQSKAIAAQQATRDFSALANRENEELQALKKRVTSLNPLDRLSLSEIYRMNALSSNQPKLRAAVENSRDAESNATIALRQQAALERADPNLALQNKYRRDVGALNKRLEESIKKQDPLAAATLPGFISPQQFEDELLRLTNEKKKAEDALKPNKVGAAGRRVVGSSKQADSAARATQRLGEFGEDAAKKIANIGDSFRDIPPEVERINRASRELDDIISDLMNRRPEGFRELIQQAESLQDAMPDMAFDRVMRQITDEAQQQVQFQMLMLQGREGEAQALRQIFQIEQNLGPLRDNQKQTIIDTGIAMQRINEQMQRASEIQGAFLDATRAVRGEVEAILGGYGSLGDLASTLRRSFQQIQGKVLTEKIFGSMFQDMDRYVREKTGIASSVDIMQTETERAGQSAGTFADTLDEATRRIMGGGSASGGVVAGASAATAWGNIQVPDLLRDPNAPITVEGRKPPSGPRSLINMTPEEYFRKMGQDVGKRWASFLEPLLGKKFAGNLGGVLGGVLEGQATTGTGFGAILGGLKELKGLPKGLTDGLGKAFGGAQAGAGVAGIGNALGIKMSNTGAQIGGAIGSLIPIPGGQIIGAIAGGLLGNLFKKVQSGYAQVRNGEVVGTHGRTASIQAEATEAANGLIDTIASLAQTFGTTLGSYDFNFGRKDDKFVVDTGSRGTFNFKSETEAMAFAVREAVQDGAFIGLSEGAKRLILNGGNLEKQIAKAAQFQNVFKELRSIKDPVGFALEELNGQFKDLIDVFKEAGASSQEFANLEELYGLKRADAIKQATDSMTSSLKGLLEELNIGSDYFSLRDRKSSALEVFNPLKARVEAGDTTAFDAFSDAARNLISIEREISGSTSPFFALLQEVTTLSQNALTGQSASISAASASDSPFAALAAQNAATASAIDNQTDALIAGIGGRLDLVNSNLIALLRGQSPQSSSDDFRQVANGGFW